MTETEAIDRGGFPGIHAEAEGERRPFALLMVHGVLFDHRDFASYCRYFSSRGYDCYAFARRGRAGVPPPNAEGVRLRDYFEDTLRVLEAVGERPVIIGHSLGALLAQMVAEQDRCRAMVLLAPAPPRGVAVRPPASALPFYLRALPAMVSGHPHLPRRDVVARVAFGAMSEDSRQALYEQMVPESGLVLREVASGVPVKRDRVRCPVLCVGGEADGVYPPRVVRAVAEHYGGKSLLYPDMDHWIMDEAGWERPACDIADWLDSLS
ncbi:MAG: alpha/beta hydrolase [Acidimicrobiales bacterium]